MTGRRYMRFMHGVAAQIPSWLPVKVTFERSPEVRIIVNSGITMSRGKYAAQAVHAALKAFDVPHGRVIVLGGNAVGISQMDVQVRDAGRTEIESGTLTAGATLYPRDDPGDNGSS